MKRIYFSLILCGILISSLHATVGMERSVQLTTTITESPPTITLNWVPQPGTGDFTIYRNTDLYANSWGSPKGAVSSTSTSWTDTDVVVGQIYEYKVERMGSPIGYGYIYAGIEVPEIESRGLMAVIVEDTYLSDFSPELSQLILDLIGDGWQVIQQTVNRNDAVSAVKSQIETIRLNNPSLTAIFLVGHVPIPYCGDMYPDGHIDHRGAWPCDGYYAFPSPIWSDTDVTSTSGTDPRNHNIPGDGKLDQNLLPYTSNSLQIGRIDMYDLPSFSDTEGVLIKKYLQKLHEYKMGDYNIERRALIDDNFPLLNEGFSGNGWRNFSSLIGADNIFELDYFTTLTNDAYLWAYGCGAGTFTSVSGIGNTINYVSNFPKVIFNMMLGSYLGDWDTSNNFLRAALASGHVLTNAWAGRPHWYFHPMGLGKTIGFGALISMGNSNSKYLPQGGFPGYGHMALMGDPSLRLFPVSPPENVFASTSPTGDVILNWMPSSDPEVLGYHVYRADNTFGNFQRVNTSLITNPSYIDDCVPLGNYVYMVRGLKLEKNSSGSFNNLSQGVFISATVNQLCLPLPVELADFNATKMVNDDVLLEWITATEIDFANFDLERSQDASTWKSIHITPAVGGIGVEANYDYIDKEALPGFNYYRLKMVNLDGSVQYSPIQLIELDKKEIQGITLSPNPTEGKLKIQFNQALEETFQVVIFDGQGKMVFNEQYAPSNAIFEERLILDTLPSGLYYVVVSFGNFKSINKLVKI